MTGPAKVGGAPTLIHNKFLAAEFLSTLDPVASAFTFQLFNDGDDQYAEILHGSLDDIWPRIQTLNTPERQVGVFVTINATDFQGRRRENVVQARALWGDADSASQVQNCRNVIRDTGAVPTLIVKSSDDRAHFYWCCDDLSIDDFSECQAALIERLGTDPAIKDPSRVMRLPGTLHLKDPSRPRLVTLDLLNHPPVRWKVDDLKAKLVLSTKPTGGAKVRKPNSAFPLADAERLRRLFGSQCLTADYLGTGLVTNLEEIESAVSAIPPMAISTELDWMKFARGLAHEARLFKGQTEELFRVFETASAAAPGYDQHDNRQRWLRYIDEALDRDDPTTIATVFSIAKQHGWRGWSPAVVTLPGNPGSTVVATTTPTTGLNVSFGGIRHRQWLYGVDLVRGEITMLASPGGVGKSSLAIAITVSIATAMALLDEKIYGSRLTALYINAEDSTIEMRRRIWAFCLKHGVAEQDLGRFLLMGADDPRTQKISFMRPDKGNFVLDDDGIAHLESLIGGHRPDVIVLDPLVALCGGGNLNDNAGMSLVMRALKRLANKFDCAILLLHHTRKGGDLSHAEAIGGASAIVNLARRALMAVSMTTEEATKLGVLPSERSSYFKTVTSKSNLAPITPDTPWYKLCSITLPNPEPPIYLSGDGVQAVTRVRLPFSTRASTGDDNKIRRAILDTIDQGKIVDGLLFPYSPNITGAKNERALVDDAITAAEAATAPHVWLEPDLRAVVTRAIGALKTDGWIVEEEIKTGRFRRGRALRVQWARTPWADKHTSPPAAEESQLNQEMQGEAE